LRQRNAGPDVGERRTAEADAARSASRRALVERLPVFPRRAFLLSATDARGAGVHHVGIDGRREPSEEIMTSQAATSITPAEGVERAREGSTTTAAEPRYVRWLDALTRADVPTVGGKGANLGELTAAGLAVPPGFVVTVDAYRRFAEAGGLAAEIARRTDALDVEDTARLDEVSAGIRALVVRTPVPMDVQRAIADAYTRLGGITQTSAPAVAVRSSATVEDAAAFSFAGMFQSFLNVRGVEALVDAVRGCWASGFTSRVIYYRARNRMATELEIAAIVQQMVNSDASGVMFTADPATGDRQRLVIEAAWGLGEVVVGGQVTPDSYVVDKGRRAIVDTRVGRKSFMLVRDASTGETRRVALDNDPRADAQVLSPELVLAIADLGVRIEEHYGAPQDVEFAVEGGRVFLTQTRPITTLAHPPAPQAPGAAATAPLVRGLGASPGRGSGTVRVLASPSDGARVQQGDVLVAPMTSPDWVPIMRRAAAIVTDAGGMTSHAAIVSRELGIPCIVGTRNGTTALRDGMVVTVDATHGVVLEGAVAAAPRPQTAAPAEAVAPSAAITATRLYVNLAEAELAEAVAARDVDGVGLLRAEFLLLSALDQTHPQQMIAEHREAAFTARMAEGIEQFARAFHPRPVIYRAMDFRSNEFRGLRGGAEHEPVEANPMIGLRGCYRYTRQPAIFALELAALAQVRSRYDNVHLMIPFVRTGSEMRECTRLIAESPLHAIGRMELWVMAEVPSIVTWLPEYVRLGVTGVSIGSNDLTQLVLGVDRDNEQLAALYDERDPAVLEYIHTIIRRCHELGVTCSICGQAPSVHPQYAEQLVRWGIDSVSVTPDALERARRNIARAEHRLLLEAATGAAADASRPLAR
jgi:pyruvate,water dikinase